MKIILLIILIVFSNGCAVRQPPIYQWGDYQKNLDVYFRGDTIGFDGQAQLMETDLVKIKSNGGSIPPGFSAHLALLYAKQGNLDKFAEYLESEKLKFPESSLYIQFLQRNFKK